MRFVVAAVVLAEIAGFVLVGRGLGVLLTLLLVVLATVLGAAILRREGGESIARMQHALRTGGDPRPALWRGGFRLAAALLLLVPGFLGDIVALLLLLPPVQRVLARRFAVQGARIVTVRSAHPGEEPPRPPQDRVIDADWEEIPAPKRPTHRPSGWTRH
ncbi:FxsA family protein [Rubellimicrobium aerolatum]|uniref:FxsA family protein n=1 Tax=Rubellimicrobium aerolatum TaxID=490979 RepID=A0ABW0SA09_9RHOB